MLVLMTITLTLVKLGYMYVLAVKKVLTAPFFSNRGNFGTKRDTTKKLRPNIKMSERFSHFILCFSEVSIRFKVTEIYRVLLLTRHALI